MASRSQAEAAAENGKPMRGGQPPVIRILEVAEEDGRTRLLKRQVPALVISGLVHVVVIAMFIMIDRFTPREVEAVEPDRPTITKIDPADESKEDLTNIDPGLDPDLQAAVDVERIDTVVVDAKVVEGEASGLQNLDSDTSSVTMEQGNLVGEMGTTGSIGADNNGLLKIGQEGAGSLISAGNLQGRSGATREKMLKAYGGNADTERAVALGLSWIAKQQKSDGHWEFDQGHQDDHIAATGMALLPFLAAGETHMYGKKYTRHVSLGLNYLAEHLGPDGHFKGAGNYSQGIATVPFCEVAGMTSDKKYKKLATMACNYIIKNQDENGSWGYNGKSAGDTSIVGWQIQALKSGKLAGITIPDQTFKQAEKFLESVASESGSQYGYRTPGGSERLTAVGLLCRQYMGWTPKQPSLAKGVSFLWEKHKPTAGDMYYTYYATQVVHFFDGPAWHRDWNPAMQRVLLPAQNTEKTKNVKPGDIGCWNADKGSIGSGCGKLGTTCLSVLTLEVFYRHLPLYKRDGAGGDKVLGVTE